MTEPAEVLHAVALVAFTMLLFVGTISTVGRAVFYRAHGFRRPRLLVRDSLMLLGFATSFGLILVARAFDIPDTVRSSIPWAVLTDVPAILAVLTYVYYELFVIERGQDEIRDWAMRSPLHLEVEDESEEDEESA